MTAPVLRVFLPPQVPFAFQTGGSPRNGGFVGVQQFGKRGLRDPPVMPHGVDTVDFCGADAVLFGGKQYRAFRLPRDFSDFSGRMFRFVSLPSKGCIYN